MPQTLTLVKLDEPMPQCNSTLLHIFFGAVVLSQPWLQSFNPPFLSLLHGQAHPHLIHQRAKMLVEQPHLLPAHSKRKSSA